MLTFKHVTAFDESLPKAHRALSRDRHFVQTAFNSTSSIDLRSPSSSHPLCSLSISSNGKLNVNAYMPDLCPPTPRKNALELEHPATLPAYILLSRSCLLFVFLHHLVTFATLYFPISLSAPGVVSSGSSVCLIWVCCLGIPTGRKALLLGMPPRKQLKEVSSLELN